MSRPNHTTSDGQTPKAAGSPPLSGDTRDAFGPSSSTDFESGRVALPSDVRAAAAALERARFDYLFLRGWDVVGADEIDMLVQPGTFDALSDILRPS